VPRSIVLPIPSASHARPERSPAARASAYGLLHGRSGGFLSACARALTPEFRLDEVADPALARRYLETKPYAFAMVELEGGTSGVEVLRHAATTMPARPRIAVGEADRVLALGRDHDGIANHVLVTPIRAPDLVAFMRATVRPGGSSAEPRLRRCWFEARVLSAGTQVDGAVVGLSGGRAVVEVAAEEIARLRLGTQVVAHGVVPITGRALRFTGTVRSAWLRRTPAGKLALRAAVDGAAAARHAAGLDEFLRRAATGVVTVLGSGREAALVADELSSAHATILAAGDDDAQLSLELRNADVAVVVGPPAAGVAHALRAVRSAEDAPAVVAIRSEATPALAPVYYQTRDRLSADALSRIVRGAVDTSRARPVAASAAAVNNKALELQSLLDAARIVGLQRSPGDAATVAAQQLERLIGADRALCHVYEPLRDVLVAVDSRADFEREVAASGGVTGLVVRTGALIHLDTAGDDARFVRELDHPLGNASDRLLLVPVRAGRDQVVAVLVASRAAAARDFSADDRDLAEAFAGHLGASFRQLSLQLEVAEVMKQRRRRLRGQADQLFRPEAMDHSEDAGHYGELLHIDLGWVGTARYYLVAAFALGLLLLCATRVHDIAVGPAVIELENSVDVLAPAGGMVEEVHVLPEQSLAAGAPLVRLASQEQRADLRRVEDEWGRLLVRRLEDPRDRATEERLTALRAELERARTRLRERTLVAPRAGTVQAVRVRPGQLVAQGEPTVSIAGHDARGYVRASLPANYRPMLAPGMALDLELAQFENLHLRLTIDQVIEPMAGPNEVAGMLASGGGERAREARVTVRAALEQQSFEYDGTSFALHDGMIGTARIRLRSRPAIFVLIPGLEAALDD
jgi:multidrug efflux pump subunit AcrA (membrane-fusion protein)